MTRTEIQQAIKDNKMIVNTINGDDIISGTYFAHLIAKAAMVFGNQLILGGAYTINEEDKLVILDHLREVTRLVEKYNVQK